MRRGHDVDVCGRGSGLALEVGDTVMEWLEGRGNELGDLRLVRSTTDVVLSGHEALFPGLEGRRDELGDLRLVDSTTDLVLGVHEALFHGPDGRGNELLHNRDHGLGHCRRRGAGRLGAGLGGVFNSGEAGVIVFRHEGGVLGDTLNEK